MKKRFSLLLVLVFAVSIVLSGCNLFVTDSKAYYAQTVATLTYTTSQNTKETITIQKEELVQSYSRYYETLSQNGYSGEALVNYLVQYLIEQKVVLNETKQLIKDEKISVTNKDLNDIYRSTLQSVENTLADYRAEVIKDLGVEEAKDFESTDEEITEYKPFEKVAEMVKEDGAYRIVIVNNEEDEEEDLITTTPIAKVKTELAREISQDRFLKEAQKRYIKALKDYYRNMGLVVNDAGAWQREIEKIYEQVENNKYYNLYTDYLQEENTIEGKTYSIVDMNDVLTVLENRLKAEYQTYSVSPSTFNTKLLGSRSDVLYIWEDASLGEYFYVSHVLVKFADGIFTELDNAKAQGYYIGNDEAYKAERNRIIQNHPVELYGDAIEGYENINTIQELYLAIQDAVNSKQTLEEKYEIFNKFVYAYSQDSGNKNVDYDYIVGTENSSMVDEFNEAARTLYINGIKGAISDKTESEYGIHILMYLNNVEPIFTISNLESYSLLTQYNEDMDAVVEKLNTPLSVMNTKTLFDLLYEDIKSDNASLIQALSVESLKAKYDIHLYTNHYSDMFGN